MSAPCCFMVVVSGSLRHGERHNQDFWLPFRSCEVPESKRKDSPSGEHFFFIAQSLTLIVACYSLRGATAEIGIYYSHMCNLFT